MNHVVRGVAGLGCAVLMCWPATPASAMQVIAAAVSHSEDAYDVSFTVEIEAEPDQVWRIVTDFANLARLSPTIVESKLLTPGTRGGAARVQVVLRPCVWSIFCKTIRKVTDATLEGRSVEHVTVAEMSDFHSARERMRVEPAARRGHSRVSYHASLVPKFFVPPLVGPYVIRKQILKDLALTATRVEALARAGGQAR